MKLGIYVILINFATLVLCNAETEERIKNGKDVTGGDFSFVAKLQLNDKHICNGILVDSKWVVTVKTCVDKKKLSQYKVYMSSSKSQGTDVMRKVTKLEVPDKKNKDVIMLELNNEVVKSIDKVTALDRFSTAKLDKKMQNCKAVGFTENGKRQSEVAVSLKLKQCKGSGTICFETKKGSVCKEDNGSPIVCKYQTKWYLTGTSFVKKKCSNKNIKGYRLSFYSSAIKKVLENKEETGCGPAPDIDNANVILTTGTTKIGSRADVNCFQGYTSNTSIVNCLESRQWETTACTAIESEKYVVRLPQDIDPLLYSIELQPDIYNNEDPKDFTFSGSVKIEINCLSDTSIITLNLNGLSINGPIVVNLDGSSENLYKNHLIESQLQFLYISTNKYLKAGNKYVLKIMKFDGVLNSKSDGFFYGSDEEDGKDVYYAATQFQPISARKAFPCFDEPALKSQYDITLVRKKSVSSLSNMPRSGSTKRDNGWVADSFERTPKMSVYLLAFFIGNHEKLEKETKNGVTFRTWSKPSALNKTTYALDVGVKIQQFFSDYFGISYPLPKQDNIAISNYGAGGMENWGLIVYTERVMLVDKDKDSSGDIELAASLVSHEIAHTVITLLFTSTDKKFNVNETVLNSPQWFGNLVTTSWWDDIWLNEGFARFYQYNGVDFAHPDWNMRDKFIYNVIHMVLLVDGFSRFTHPLHNPVYKPSDINTKVFGTIPYNKGAAVIRMLSFMVGGNTFKDGIRNYLKKNSYKAVTYDDLYSAIEEEAIIDEKSITNIKEIMDTWVLQMHYPLVNVEFTQEGKITLTQEKYEGNPGSVDPGNFESPYGYKWNIPFAYTTSKRKNFEVRSQDITILPLNKKKVNIKDDSIPKPKGNLRWVIGNPQQFGLYRVRYDRRNWNALTDQLVSDHKVIHVINRAQIIEDAFSLYTTDYQSLAIALRTLEYLNNEEEWLPWVTGKKWIDYLSERIGGTGEFNAYKAFIASRVEKIYTSLVLNTKNYTQIQLSLKDNVYFIACFYGLPLCVNETIKEIADWSLDPENLSDEDIEDYVYCEALSDENSEYWEFVFEQFKNELENIKRRRLQALACNRNKANLERLLQYAVNTSDGKVIEDTLYYMSNHQTGRAIAWDYVLASWDSWLVKYIEGYLGLIMTTLTGTFATDEDLTKFETFLDDESESIGRKPFLSKNLDDILAGIKERNVWIDTNLPLIQSWLNGLGY